MIKTAKGVLVVWNEPGNYFTIEIKGNVRPSQQPLLFQLDGGKGFQIQMVDKKAFLKNPNDKSLDDKTILAAHRDWEGDYISGIIHSKLKIDSVWLKLANSTDALAWSYEMPTIRNIPPGTRQLYLGVVKRNHVFLLNSEVAKNDDEKETRQFVLDTMNTMRSSDKPLSLKAASEQVMKEN